MEDPARRRDGADMMRRPTEVSNSVGSWGVRRLFRVNRVSPFATKHVCSAAGARRAIVSGYCTMFSRVSATLSCSKSSNRTGDRVLAFFDGPSLSRARGPDGTTLASFRVTYICDELLVARADDEGLLIFEKEQ